MQFYEWLVARFPHRGNNSHTTYTIEDMHKAFNAGVLNADSKGSEKMESQEEQNENVAGTADDFNSLETHDRLEERGQAENDVVSRKKTHKAKTTSLAAQTIAALWVAVWCGLKFYREGGATTDIIFSGFAIAACFSPVYFSMILDKIKNIKFGE